MNSVYRVHVLAWQVSGTPEERGLVLLAIDITLQQRNGGSVTTNFAQLEARDDVSTLDVPKATVGFLLGAKGATLRQMEGKHRVFMFFNNHNVREAKHVRRTAPPPRRSLATASQQCSSASAAAAAAAALRSPTRPSDSGCSFDLCRLCFCHFAWSVSPCAFPLCLWPFELWAPCMVLSL